MQNPLRNKLLTLLLVFAAIWLGLRYLLPISLPFLLGLGIALAAEPAVRFATGRLHLPRGLSAGICVTGTLLLLLSLLVMVGSLLLRQLGQLADAMPDLEQTARQGLTSLQDLLLSLAYRAPEGMQPLLIKVVLGLFSGSSQMVDEVTRKLPAMATSVLGHIPGSALTLFTAVLSAFMVSARLPKITAWLRAQPLSARFSGVLPTVKKVRQALGGWLKAQLRLSGMSFAILLAGFLLLRVDHAPVLALLVALVDAVPLLGTGTVLLPWSLVCFVQGDSLRGLGLLGIYAATLLTRSTLEPRLVGKQLGLDPLVTLLALYTGYQLLGLAGMLLAPVLSVTVRELTANLDGN